jgi:hypothetical protein
MDGSEWRARPAPSAASLTRGLEILRAFTADDATLGQPGPHRDGRDLPKATDLAPDLDARRPRLSPLRRRCSAATASAPRPSPSATRRSSTSAGHPYRARPLMQDLADRTGAAVALGARDGLEMVYLANCRSMTPVSLAPQCRLAPADLPHRHGPRLSGRNRSRTCAQSVVAATRRGRARQRADELAAARRRTRSSELPPRTASSAPSACWHSYINAVGVAFRPTDGSPLVALTCGGIVDILSR